jgi:hypothetical protein
MKMLASLLVMTCNATSPVTGQSQTEREVAHCLSSHRADVCWWIYYTESQITHIAIARLRGPVIGPRTRHAISADATSKALKAVLWQMSSELREVTLNGNNKPVCYLLFALRGPLASAVTAANRFGFHLRVARV